MTERGYERFVGTLVEKHGARWAAIILDDGNIPAYRAYDRGLDDMFLRAARSFYWSLLSMGDMVDMPELEGKYLEIVWTEKKSHSYLYLFRLENEILMINTENKIEEFMIDLISGMSTESGPDVPGLVGFGIGDYEGNTISSYINMDLIQKIGGMQYEEEDVKKIFEETARLILKQFSFMGESGFGDGRYTEVGWENVTGWMFPYRDKIAVAMFETDRVDTLINIISKLLEDIMEGV